MKIKTKFFYLDKGKYFNCGGEMLIKNRKIVKLGSIEKEECMIPFYYNDTQYEITHEKGSERSKVLINKIITESSYTVTQQEYLTYLNWIQREKLLWMFNRHWFQNSRNIIHILFLILIVSISIVGYELATNSF